MEEENFSKSKGLIIYQLGEVEQDLLGVVARDRRIFVIKVLVHQAEVWDSGEISQAGVHQVVISGETKVEFVHVIVVELQTILSEIVPNQTKE